MFFARDMTFNLFKNGNTLIGLFQGMFENNILTFNPGWDENANLLEQFDDVRVLQTSLETNDITIDKKADSKIKGPESIVLTDPDGNSILIDQYV